MLHVHEPVVASMLHPEASEQHVTSPLSQRQGVGVVPVQLMTVPAGLTADPPPEAGGCTGGDVRRRSTADANDGSFTFDLLSSRLGERNDHADYKLQTHAPPMAGAQPLPAWQHVLVPDVGHVHRR